MSNENANQPAYPVIKTEEARQGNFNNGDIYGNTYSKGGLTKRELIAAMAMQGFCASGKFILNPEAVDTKVLVRKSVECADELLNQLSKP